MRSNLTGYLVAVALGAALAREHNRRRQVEASHARCSAVGAVDLEPVVCGLEDAVAALKLNGSRRPRSADVAAIRAVP